MTDFPTNKTSSPNSKISSRAQFNQYWDKDDEVSKKEDSKEGLSWVDRIKMAKVRNKTDEIGR